MYILFYFLLNKPENVLELWDTPPWQPLYYIILLWFVLHIVRIWAFHMVKYTYTYYTYICFPTFVIRPHTLHRVQWDLVGKTWINCGILAIIGHPGGLFETGCQLILKVVQKKWISYTKKKARIEEKRMRVQVVVAIRVYTVSSWDVGH